MELIGRKRLDDFKAKYGDAKSQIDAFCAEVEEALWETSMDIKKRYPHASFLADNRVIFNIKGNQYRLETKISYRNKIVYIKRIGTHAEYSKWSFE